jgi:hypothetical protein
LQDKAKQIDALREHLVSEIIAVKHPNWKDTRENAAFIEWRMQQGGVDSDTPSGVVAILDRYAQHVASKKKPADIVAERDKRLKQSQVVPTKHKERLALSESEMSTSELRQKAAREIWSN